MAVRPVTGKFPLSGSLIRCPFPAVTNRGSHSPPPPSLGGLFGCPKPPPLDVACPVPLRSFARPPPPSGACRLIRIARQRRDSGKRSSGRSSKWPSLCYTLGANLTRGSNANAQPAGEALDGRGFFFRAGVWPWGARCLARALGLAGLGDGPT